MALHEQSVGATSEWYTPPHVFEALGCNFDVDVASPGRSATPWIPASTFITEASMFVPWTGFIWMNPPFGGRNGLIPWLTKFFEHRNGIALVPDRTSAPWWQTYATQADLILFISPKLKFLNAAGRPGNSPAQGTCLLGSGPGSVAPLHNAARKGLGTLMQPVLK